MSDCQVLSTNNTLKLDPRSDLIAAASQFYKQGWMVGTAGNLSARLPDGSFWITASGKSKGELTISDFIRVGNDGMILERSHSDLKPSAETEIHQIIYQLFPEAQACYHVHSIEANLVSRFGEEDNLLLPPLEMLKGFGIKEEKPRCFIPIFANHLQVSKIAEEIGDRFRIHPPQIPALLLRDHGVTVWANSTEVARNYIELVEYIFRYMVVACQVNIQY
ncbi:methylthioribulose 1-phosphate dehydratase [Aerosakkonema sp. BLCC-F183]|uniref:methylthioribulose 1-phosphate dehydratase n=1 Tax=Aerosakkonema sp. BLCC-F183 TaxID=3342834 RepID=UPI0035BBCD21